MPEPLLPAPAWLLPGASKTAHLFSVWGNAACGRWWRYERVRAAAPAAQDAPRCKVCAKAHKAAQ